MDARKEYNGRHEEYTFSFQGYLSNDELRQADINTEGLIAELSDDSYSISRDIEKEIQKNIPVPSYSKVQISFSNGSLEWFGVVELALDWMARLGGAIGLVTLIYGGITRAIDRVLRRRIPRTNVQTSVVLVSTSRPQYRRPFFYRRSFELMMMMLPLWLVLTISGIFVFDRSSLSEVIRDPSLGFIGFITSIVAVFLSMGAFWISTRNSNRDYYE